MHSYSFNWSDQTGLCASACTKQLNFLSRFGSLKMGNLKKADDIMELEDPLCRLLVYSSHQATINVTECSYLCWPSYVLNTCLRSHSTLWSIRVEPTWGCVGLVLGSTKIHSSVQTCTTWIEPRLNPDLILRCEQFVGLRPTYCVMNVLRVLLAAPFKVDKVITQLRNWALRTWSFLICILFVAVKLYFGQVYSRIEDPTALLIIGCHSSRRSATWPHVISHPQYYFEPCRL